MTRNTKTSSVDGRRCSDCRKLAKDIIDGKHYCRIHSPKRIGFYRGKGGKK